MAPLWKTIDEALFFLVGRIGSCMSPRSSVIAPTREPFTSIPPPPATTMQDIFSEEENHQNGKIILN